MKTLILSGWVLATVLLLGACRSTGTLEEASTGIGARGQGVVVESVGGWALEKAGIQAGDVLLSWKRLPNPPANPEVAEGVLTSYFEWLELLEEQAPRGTVVLGGQRDGEPRKFTVEPGLWESEVRPVLPPALEEIYSTGRSYLTSGNIEAAVRAWSSLVAGAAGEDGRVLRVWIALRIGETWGEQGDWEKAIESFREALEAGKSPLAQIVAWAALGDAHESRNELEAAEDAYHSTLKIRQKLSPESLGVASSLRNLGGVAWDCGDLERAQYYFRRALKIKEKLAPKSLTVATSLLNLIGCQGSRQIGPRSRVRHQSSGDPREARPREPRHGDQPE